MPVKSRALPLKECKQCPDHKGIVKDRIHPDKDSYVQCERVKGTIGAVLIKPSNWEYAIKNNTPIVHCLKGA